jgi:hypothetical protein
LSRWVPALALCAGAVFLPSAGAAASLAGSSGSIGIQLVDAPTNRRFDPRAQRYIVDHLAPGTVIQRRVNVINKSGENRRIQVYAGSATIEQDRFVFGEGATPNELTSWISFEHGVLDLEPYSEQAVQATISVPPKASTGERYGVLWASSISAPDSAAITQIHRVGVRVYLEVGEGGEPVSNFDIGDITPARAFDRVPSLAVAVRNTGGRALDMTGTVHLVDGPAGLRAGPFPITIGTTLAPGGAGTVTVSMPPDLPAGPWKAELKLASGMIERTATTTFSFPDPGDPPGKSLLGLPYWAFFTGASVLVLAMLTGLGVKAFKSRNEG